MKSMLHEGASIVKAIEKAWKESGKPSEFTVNILEVGEKNFLGLTKRPAVVSITYDPRKSARGPEKQLLSHQGYRGRPAPAPQRGRVEQRGDQRGEQRQRREGDRAQGQRQQYPPAQQQQQRPVREQQQPIVREPRQDRIFEPAVFWTPEQVADVKSWLKEFLPLLSINVSFEATVDNKMLRIIFAQKLFDSRDDERQLFGGLSYLLIQFLKKKHKQKLRGYHLVINSKDHAAGEQS